MEGKYFKRKLKNFFNKNSNAIMNFFESIPYEIKKIIVKKQIFNENFSVISNNCWGGRVYKYLDLPYLTPTAGLYIFSSDYIKFISDLHYYFDQELVFIDAAESKYYDLIAKRNELMWPIAKLGDIEIIFRHYKTPEEAEAKWNRRKQRVNFDNIIIKFSRMYECTDKEFEAFAKIPFNNKIFIDNRKPLKYDWQHYTDSCDEYGYILNDTQPFPQKINLANVLNVTPEKYPDEGFDISEYLKSIGEYND